jgi:hypothetical protein
VEQSRVTQNRKLVHDLAFDPALAGLCLKISVSCHFLDQFLQPNFDLPHAAVAAIKPGYRGEVSNQVVHPLGLEVDPVEHSLSVGAGALTGKLECNAQSRQRRTQFVRNVLQQSALCTDQFLDLFRHQVEIPQQLRNFIPALR